MKLKRGIYEQIINKALSEEIKKNINDIDVYKDIVNYSDSNKILSTYLSYVFKKGLNYYKSSQKDLDKQIEITNEIIKIFSKLIEDEEFNSYKIYENNILKVVFDKEINKKDINNLHTIMPVSRNSLFTGSNTEPTVFS